MSGFTLFPFQEEPVRKALAYFRKPVGRPVIVAPTGSGKSVMIAEIVRQLNGDVLVLQPSAELLKQNKARFDEASAGKIESAVFSASLRAKNIAQVTFATIGTAVNNIGLFKHFQYVIIDECHLVPPKAGSQYKRFFKQINRPTLGFTATPYRLKSFGKFNTITTKLVMLHSMRPRFFTEILHVLQNSELAGFWPKVDYILKGFDGSVLKLNSSGSDYTDESVKEALILNETTVKIRNFLQVREKKGIIKHCLIFVRSIEDAEALAGILPHSAAVHSKMKTKERDAITAGFLSGKIKYLFNVGIYTTGFDFPKLQMVIIGRPTNSLALYYQMIGRLLRRHPDKPIVRLIDFGGNCRKFGPVEGLNIDYFQNKLHTFSAAGKRLTGVALSQFTIKKN